MKHTKGKWKVFNLTDIFPDDGDLSASRQIADCFCANDKLGLEERKANARRIVKCINNHDELVERIEALEQLLACYRIGRPPTEKLYHKLGKTRQALANARKS